MTTPRALRDRTKRVSFFVEFARGFDFVIAFLGVAKEQNRGQFHRISSA